LFISLHPFLFIIFVHHLHTVGVSERSPKRHSILRLFSSLIPLPISGKVLLVIILVYCPFQRCGCRPTVCTPLNRTSLTPCPYHHDFEYFQSLTRQLNCVIISPFSIFNKYIYMHWYCNGSDSYTLGVPKRFQRTGSRTSISSVRTQPHHAFTLRSSKSRLGYPNWAGRVKDRRGIEM
jgi:hypothetical protein